MRKLSRRAPDLQRPLAACRARSLDLIANFSPGLLDAGCASLAGFASSLYAARTLDLDTLGAYGLYFSALFLVGRLQDQFYLLPARIHAIDQERTDRVAILSWSLPIGISMCFPGACLVLLAGLPVVDQIPESTLAGLAVTAAVLCLLSPLQDHMRAVCHLANRSWLAASISASQLLAATAAVAWLHSSRVPPEWVPFGALAIANLVSLVFGLVQLAPKLLRARVPYQPVCRLLHSGRSLALAELMPSLALFSAPAIVATLASAEAVGFAESARIAAQPIIVLGMGIGAILNPRLLEAGASGSHVAARRALYGFALIATASGLVYLTSFGWAHPWNPMQLLLPTAYLLPGLVALRISAATLLLISNAPTSILYGARRNASILRVRGLAAIITIAATATVSTWAHAYSLSLAKILAGIAAGALAFRYSLLPSQGRQAPDRTHAQPSLPNVRAA